jgi:nucleoside-diphosphate-sugar epimerase
MSELIFVTGGTGHIGFKTIVSALNAGYRVRAAVRSEAKGSQILEAASIKALSPGSNLTFVVVPDLTIEGAYDEAVKGAKFIIHQASPIVLKGEIKPEDFESALIGPAVAATVSILKAANKTTGIQRIVITSSIVALIPQNFFFSENTPAGQVYNEKSRTSFEKGPYPSGFHAYNAGKVAALEATENFIAKESPSFDVVNIAPSFVIGKNELIISAKEFMIGTNVAAWGIVLGNKSSQPVAGASVHVNDVALLHVKALSDNVPAGIYIANSEGLEGTKWESALQIVAKHFPKAIKNSIIPNNGEGSTRKLPIDSSKAENIFGIKFLSYEEQVKSVGQHYLELLREEVE